MANGFEEWAVVELMGHLKLAGKVSEATIAGASLLRIDVPELPTEDGRPAQPGYTKFFGPASIYSITPCDQDVAMRVARYLRRAPIQRYELAPALPPPPPADAEPVEDDDPADPDGLAMVERQLQDDGGVIVSVYEDDDGETWEDDPTGKTTAEMLEDVGLTIAASQCAAWTPEQRREAEGWSDLVAAQTHGHDDDLPYTLTDLSQMPAHVAAAAGLCSVCRHPATRSIDDVLYCGEHGPESKADAPADSGEAVF